MRALVTGGSGFIGSHVVRALLSEDVEVRVLHLASDPLTNLADLDVERVEGDVMDAAAVARAVRGCDWVFHLAAIYALWTRNPGRLRAVNVAGTRTVLEAALRAGVQRVVHTSSIARFGGQGRGRLATEQSPFALGVTGDLYSRTKAESHAVALELADRGLDVTIVAPCGPIGPGDVGPTPTGRLLLGLLQSPIPILVDSVTNFIDVRDCAQGHLLAAKAGKTGETYLLGAHNLTYSELLTEAQSLLGVRGRIFTVPLPAAKLAAHGMKLVADRLTHKAPLFTPAVVEIARLGLAADASKAVRELGLPQRPIRESLRDALVWFAERGYISQRKLKARVLELA